MRDHGSPAELERRRLLAVQRVLERSLVSGETKPPRPDPWTLLRIEIPVPQRILGVQNRGRVPRDLPRLAAEEPTPRPVPRRVRLRLNDGLLQLIVPGLRQAICHFRRVPGPVAGGFG